MNAASLTSGIRLSTNHPLYARATVFGARVISPGKYGQPTDDPVPDALEQADTRRPLPLHEAWADASGIKWVPATQLRLEKKTPTVFLLRPCWQTWRTNEPPLEFDIGMHRNALSLLQSNVRGCTRG